MKKILNILFSPVTMAVLLIVAALVMATATFIENDFGTDQARLLVYNAWWFELIWILLIINLLGAIFDRKLYSLKKFPVFLFHVAFIVILIGAAVTRYFGYEGQMHIREGASSSIIETQAKALTVQLTTNDVKGKITQFRDDFSKDHSFKASVPTSDGAVDIALYNYFQNAYPKAVEEADGVPVVGFVLANNDYRGFGYIQQGESKVFGSTSVSFDVKNDTSDFQFSQVNDTIYLRSKSPMVASDMGDEQKTELNSQTVEAELKKLYHSAGVNLIVQELYNRAVVIPQPAELENNQRNQSAMVFDINFKGGNKQVTIWENRDALPEFSTLTFGNSQLRFTYGQYQIQLPFSIHLDNFEIERYPGSHSPSSFSSYVTIQRPNEAPKPFHIYMNNILNMNGFRFYQSSYDQDEKGTILSVNHDSWGTAITYTGYLLMVIGIIWSMVNKNTFFRNTRINMKKTTTIILFLLAFGSTRLFAAQTVDPTNDKPIDIKHADQFGQLLIQDSKGRTEPIYTFASDLLRKISRKERMFNLTAVQIFMEMNMDYQHWMQVPMIRVANRDLQKKVGITSGFAAYTDLVSPTSYKLQDLVSQAYAKSPSQRNKFDKEVIKTDERVNICYSIYSGSFLKIFPVPESTQHQWYTAQEAFLKNKISADSVFLANILPVYFQELTLAKESGNYKSANEFLSGIKKYQQKYATYELPGEFKNKVELIYYKSNVFKKLFPAYALLGFVFIILLITSIIRGNPVPKFLDGGFFYLMLIGFIAHTLALAARWYISGHAPMSNGYESMVFIAWVTILAGFIFNRQSPFALASTAILASLTLMVANLSFMDPEITNLVPVLKSYWLSMHVSIITGSYGFLGLGAILGIINLILFSLQNEKNYKRIEDTIYELTVLNHRTLTLGLYLVTIGTFLGGVWANESWGRYWGWDPKETWALITILVYSVVVHARMVKGMRGTFAFNILSVYGYSSVIMTYFGVNYYLSGMHSYASGDPVPVPTFVYYTVSALVLLTLFAWFKSQLNKRTITQE